MKSFALLSLVLLGSCAGVQTGQTVSYQDNIKGTYEAAEKAFAAKLYEDAHKHFEEVRSKYPYSKYAVLSDLRLGDLYFAQEKWLEAADAYDFYLRFHPRHEQNAYAWFQIAKAYYNAIPENYFFLPSNYVKDQTATAEALTALDKYLAQYPEDKSVEEARKMRLQLRSQLAARDLHVGQFYLKRNKVKGAAARFEYVSKNFADTPEGEKAQAALEQIIQEDT
ncbi:MAG: outer membrane protein assembly factor BamD [Myxococcota bacterium]